MNTKTRGASPPKPKSRAREESLRAFLRAKLLRHRQKLIANIARNLEATVNRPGWNAEDIGDMAVNSLETEKSLQIGTAASRAVAEIDRALRKIEDGSYGICEECGKRIPAARLRALPFAVLCRQCQEAAERSSEQEETEYLRDWEDTLFEDNDEGGVADHVKGSIRLSL